MTRDRPLSLDEVQRREGTAFWTDSTDGVAVVFAGRSPLEGMDEVLRAVGDREGPICSLRQVHSARVVLADASRRQEGDGLVTDRTGLILTIATADCVPVVVGSGTRLAALHAGWRGIAEGIVGNGARAVVEAGDTLAWIGPAIGPCCYEVGEDVARAVAEVSHPGVVSKGPTGRPHLDLPRAVRHQLAAAGVGRILEVEACTRCRPELLWSYRRDGAAAGRNLTFAWLRETDQRETVEDRRNPRGSRPKARS